MKVQKGQLLGYSKILNALEGLSKHTISGFEELKLLSNYPVINSLLFDANFTHLPAD